MRIGNLEIRWETAAARAEREEREQRQERNAETLRLAALETLRRATKIWDDMEAHEDNVRELVHVTLTQDGVDRSGLAEYVLPLRSIPLSTGGSGHYVEIHWLGDAQPTTHFIHGTDTVVLHRKDGSGRKGGLGE